jgi:hypothetical protein
VTPGSDLPETQVLARRLRWQTDNPGEPAASRNRRRREWAQLLADMRSLSDELYRDLTRIDARSAAAPSLCTGWDVRDVVVHLLTGDDLARRGPQP